jgi:hypothetical protein
MTAFEDFWLPIGDRIKIATPPAERSLEARRALAARAFEKWRLGLLDIEPYFGQGEKT